MQRKIFMCITLILMVLVLFFSVSCSTKTISSETSSDLTTEIVQEEIIIAEKNDKAEEIIAIQEEIELNKKKAIEKKMKQEMEFMRKFEQEDIHFDYNSAMLLEGARLILLEKANWLLNNEDSNIIIEGFCDERGTVEYNLALGERRAESAKTFLVDLGIKSGRINTISFGEENPIDPAHTEAAWAKNRRCHFVLQ